MDGDTFLAQLRDDFETELSRLGSSKALYAVTGGEMDGPSVRAAADDEAATAATVFSEWADAEPDADAADLFADVVAVAEDHRSEIGSERGSLDTDQLMYETLAGLDTTPERLGGLLARQVVTGQLVSQMVGFFVGNADPGTADVFRSIKDDFEDHQTRALHVLEDVCDDEDDWDDARAAAAATVESAYDYYVETLESMGVKPKNVC
jgi:hypothetical protein